MVKDNIKIAGLVGIIIISIFIGYQVLFGFNLLGSGEFNLNKDKFEFESTEIELGTTELHLNETIVHTGRVDGQLIKSNALKHTNLTDSQIIDILPALKREDSHGTVPLGWDVYGL
jgi:hypothetical protein